MSYMKFTACFEPILAKGLASIHSKLVNRDKQVSQAPKCFLEGSQKVQAPHNKWPCNQDCLQLLGRSVVLPCQVLASPI
jgi:hypothetical protein